MIQERFLPFDRVIKKNRLIRTIRSINGPRDGSGFIERESYWEEERYVCPFFSAIWIRHWLKYGSLFKFSCDSPKRLWKLWHLNLSVSFQPYSTLPFLRKMDALSFAVAIFWFVLIGENRMSRWGCACPSNQCEVKENSATDIYAYPSTLNVKYCLNGFIIFIKEALAVNKCIWFLSRIWVDLWTSIITSTVIWIFTYSNQYAYISYSRFCLDMGQIFMFVSFAL